MNKPSDTADSGTPREAVFRDRAAELSRAVLGREAVGMTDGRAGRRQAAGLG